MCVRIGEWSEIQRKLCDVSRATATESAALRSRSLSVWEGDHRRLGPGEEEGARGVEPLRGNLIQRQESDTTGIRFTKRTREDP